MTTAGHAPPKSVACRSRSPLDDQLSDDERLIRDVARGYAQERLRPRPTGSGEARRTDRAILRELGELGLLGPMIPEADGGAGVGHVAYGLISRELERADPATRSMMTEQSSHVMHPIHAYGSEEQRRRYLPRLAAGDWLGCSTATESHDDAHGGAPWIEAVATAGGYRLRGSMVSTSAAPAADVFVIWTTSEQCGHTVRAFVLDKGTNGLSASQVDDPMRAAPTARIHLADVEVGGAARLPGVTGPAGFPDCAASAMYGNSWGALGAAEACLDAMRHHDFGRPDRSDPQVQLLRSELADMRAEIDIGLLTILRAGRLLEQGAMMPEMIGLVRRDSCRRALRIVRKVSAMQEATNITASPDVLRHLWNLEASCF